MFRSFCAAVSGEEAPPTVKTMSESADKKPYKAAECLFSQCGRHRPQEKKCQYGCVCTTKDPKHRLLGHRDHFPMCRFDGKCTKFGTDLHHTQLYHHPKMHQSDFANKDFCCVCRMHYEQCVCKQLGLPKYEGPSA